MPCLQPYTHAAVHLAAAQLLSHARAAATPRPALTGIGCTVAPCASLRSYTQQLLQSSREVEVCSSRCCTWRGSIVQERMCFGAVATDARPLAVPWCHPHHLVRMLLHAGNRSITRAHSGCNPHTVPPVRVPPRPLCPFPACLTRSQCSRSEPSAGKAPDASISASTACGGSPLPAALALGPLPLPAGAPAPPALLVLPLLLLLPPLPGFWLGSAPSTGFGRSRMLQGGQGRRLWRMREWWPRLRTVVVQTCAPRPGGLRGEART